MNRHAGYHGSVLVVDDEPDLAASVEMRVLLFLAHASSLFRHQRVTEA